MRFTRVCRNLHNQIARHIRHSGPMPIANFMQMALANPRSGYYVTRDPITPEGDFVTSPEVHQMFGELIGAWAMQEWIVAGSPDEFEYIELGPGRGTLARDVSKTVSGLLGKSGKAETAIKLNLMEISPVLSKKQAETLEVEITEVLDDSQGGPYMTGRKQNTTVQWFRTIDHMSEANDISFLVCNEFFDALPIHQFEFDEKSGKWLEVLVDLDPSLGEEDVLRFVLSPGQTPAGRALIPMFEENDLEGKKRIEVSPATLYHSQRISERILSKGGSALIIDYGHEGEKEDTFRAFKNHQLTDALKDVGESDLTADVNFSHIRAVAQSMGLDATHSISQATFLKNMGIETRLLMLLRSTKDSAERKNLTSCYEFLVDKMGNRFRAMALTHPARKQSGQEVPGFYEIQQDFSAFMRAPPSVEFDIEDKKMVSGSVGYLECAVEPAVDAWAVKMTEGRDPSHAIGHFRRVRDFVQQIATEMKDEIESANRTNLNCAKVLISASLLHDVFDHKYASSKESSDGMEVMCAFLKELKFSEAEVDGVIKICENVSYSKEKKGKLEKLETPIDLLRNIVSDADKLDAIGYAGIERCRMYQKHRFPNASEEEIENGVVEHMHDKLLKLLPEYIRTSAAKDIGTSLQLEMENYLKQK